MGVVGRSIERIDIPSRWRGAFAVAAFFADNQIVRAGAPDHAHDLLLRTQIGGHDTGSGRVLLLNMELRAIAAPDDGSGDLRSLIATSTRLI